MKSREKSAMEANWSNGAQDAAAAVMPHKVEATAHPEQDDASYAYHTQGLCRFVHTQCEKELFTTEYLRCALLRTLWGNVRMDNLLT